MRMRRSGTDYPAYQGQQMAHKSEPSTVAGLAVGLVCLTSSSPSYAYLDPGTGSIILQSILGVIAVAMGLLRLYWYRFKQFVSNLTTTSRDEAPKEAQEFGQDSDFES